MGSSHESSFFYHNLERLEQELRAGTIEIPVSSGSFKSLKSDADIEQPSVCVDPVTTQW